METIIVKDRAELEALQAELRDYDIDCELDVPQLPARVTYLKTEANGYPHIVYTDEPIRPSFTRTMSLIDDASTREKHKVMDKMEIMTDDARNPDFEGLEGFLQFGRKYKITIEDIGDA